MSAPAITFIKGEGGLGRGLTTKDHISGLNFYVANGSLPSGFTTTARVKALYSPADAISAGIANDYSDATGAGAVYTFTNVGAAADTVELKVADIDANGVARSLSLGVFTRTASEITVTLLAAAYKAVVNAGTLTHGYSADNTAGALALTGPKRLGIYLNTGSPLTATIVGTIAGSVTTAFTGGIASLKAQWYYQISEYFRMQPKGVLFVGFYAIPATYTFTDIADTQTFAVGEIRQIGVMKDPTSAFSTANLTTIQSVLAGQETLKKPLSALYAADLSGTADITTLTDLGLLSAPLVSAVIAQDGGGQGNYLWLTTGKSHPCLGALLGTVALSSVGENVGWIEKYNISNGIENEVLAFANGQKYNSSAISDSAIDTLSDKRYIFLKKFTGSAGSYWVDSHTAVIVSSDYAYIENNRVIHKAMRNLYAGYLPQLNSPLRLNSDGTLADVTIVHLESVGEVALDAMVRDGEISAKKVEINNAQNVLSTSKLVVAATLVINGVARKIEIPIGFKPKITE